MKKTTILTLFGVLLIGLGIFFFMNKGSSTLIQTDNNQDSLKITLSMKDYNYFPSIITANVGQPVEIALDSSVKGCYRSFTIRDLGVVKYSKNEEDTIKFTPNKKGTYRFACSMGMGYGTIIIQ